jgi:hypothetical protein
MALIAYCGDTTGVPASVAVIPPVLKASIHAGFRPNAGNAGTNAVIDCRYIPATEPEWH